jgi:serine/threonine protein kinase
VSHVNQSAIHCINPDCQRPYPQPWGHKFCNSCGSPLQLFDRYIPLQRLGEGGFARIYTVWDNKTETEKVLKVLVESSPKALELFEQEAAVLCSLRHAGVPRVDRDGFFQVNLTNRQLPCLVMEKIYGQTLEEVLQNYPQGCPENLVVNWLTQAIDILQELHRRKIIHRDIKPSNLMLRGASLGSGNQLVLIDFGGAKQFSPAFFGGGASTSTRLYSSGYSPPEQLTGTSVSPTADFYALGRTFIELLTGKYPADLENPRTGEFRWRNLVNINPMIADLLDEMVEEDRNARPANANIIKLRLKQINRSTPQPGFISQWEKSTKQAITNLNQNLNQSLNQHFQTHVLIPQQKFFSSVEKFIAKGISYFAIGVSETIKFIFQTISNVLIACWDTIWSMIITGIFTSLGTFAGFFLAYYTVWGDRFATFMSQSLPVFVPANQPSLGAEMLLFACAGLSTAWGITLAGAYRQRRRYLISSVMGTFAYACGWFLLHIVAAQYQTVQYQTVQYQAEGLLALAFVGVPLLTLGLGLRSHHVVHAAMATLGTAALLTGLVYLRLPPVILQSQSETLRTWSDCIVWVSFFGLMGIFISFSLGISNYLIVPTLRVLGWR